MNDGQYPQQGGYEDRGDGRDRRDEYAPQYSHAHSPPTSASPFAFAPPPLSSMPGSSRPSLPMHHSEPIQPYNYYAKATQPPPYAYLGSHPMGYRSVSNEATQRSSPSQPSLTRVPSLPGGGGGMVGAIGGPPPASQPSPNSSSYAYARPAPSPYPPAQHSSSPRAGMYATPPYYPSPYAQPGAVDTPRSLTYPTSYSQPYGNYIPGVTSPSVGHGPEHSHPSLARHASSNSISGSGPNVGYSFANRLPLVDRPFKCDECVQSFNRNHDLKRHKRIHLSVKPFGCDKCGKTFSRKDALRRHWLVKGCRGEDGATAPITPTFPLNPSPALSPSTPTDFSSTDPKFQPKFQPIDFQPNGTPSYSHPGAPPPLTTLPSRQPSDQSQIILTPDDVAAQQQPENEHAGHSGRGSIAVPPLEEPLVLDVSQSQRGSTAKMDGDAGYFDGVVGIRKDGTALMDKTPDSVSPYSRYANSPNNPQYRRPTLGSPTTANTYPVNTGNGAATPSSMGADGKPVFAMPFTPNGAQTQAYLAPPGGEDMEKQESSESAADSTSWQRWHRPSFPFPAPPTTFGIVDSGAQTYAA